MVTDTVKPGSQAEVLVIGEALVDIVRTPDETTERPGGSPANVALGLGRLGIAVALLTSLGRDERGQAIEQHLTESGVRVLDSSFGAPRTATAVATIAPDGSASYEFDIEWAIDSAAVPASPRLIHTGSIGAFLEPGAAGVRDILRRAGGAIVTFDPNIRPALLGPLDEVRAVFENTASLSTVVKLSDEDAEWLYPGVAPDDVLKSILSMGPSLAAMTLGADGSMLAADGVVSLIPPVVVDVVDTIGAGDTYMTSLIASLLERDQQASFDRSSIEGIGHRAGRAAAITVSRAGADLPWRHELSN